MRAPMRKLNGDEKAAIKTMKKLGAVSPERFATLEGLAFSTSCMVFNALEQDGFARLTGAGLYVLAGEE